MAGVLIYSTHNSRSMTHIQYTLTKIFACEICLLCDIAAAQSFNVSRLVDLVCYYSSFHLTCREQHITITLRSALLKLEVVNLSSLWSGDTTKVVFRSYVRLCPWHPSSTPFSCKETLDRHKGVLCNH